MIKISLSLSKEPNINNAPNANIGWRGEMAAQLWYVNADNSFAMIVEEPLVLMGCAQI